MSSLIDEKQLKKAFNDAKQSDGKVTITDFKNILRNNGLDINDKSVAFALSHSKTELDEAALAEFLKTLQVELEKNMALDQNKRKIFDMIDADHNGFLDRYEVKMAFAMLNKPFTDADVEELMTEADTDNDGRISFDEFKSSKASEKFTVDLFGD